MLPQIVLLQLTKGISLLPKTNRNIHQWDQWLGHFPGSAVLQAEQKFLPRLLTDLYGTNALLIGTPKQYNLLNASVIPNKVLLSPLLSHHHHKEVHSIESDLHELPISTGCIDLVLLPHLLEYLDNPRRLVSEACRIVKPEGHIAIVGFNPYSLWGIRKIFSTKKNIPWNGNFIQANSLKRWLVLADFEIVTHKSFYYRAPLKHEGLFKKLGIIEWLGKKCYPSLGAIYVLIAKAKVVPLTPIKLSWKQKLSDVRIPAIGIPRPTTRNKT